MRQRCGPHTGNRREAAPQFGVERGGSRHRIPGLGRVQLEQQHVLGIEAERHRFEIRKRLTKQPGSHQQQQQERDLTNNERLLQAQTRNHVAPNTTRLTGARVLQLRHQRRTRRLNRGREAEQHPAQHRQAHRDGEHVPVQFGVKGESRITVGQQQCEQAHAGNRNKDAEHSAERREDDAFGQHLTD